MTENIILNNGTVNKDFIVERLRKIIPRHNNDVGRYGKALQEAFGVKEDNFKGADFLNQELEMKSIDLDRNSMLSLTVVGKFDITDYTDQTLKGVIRKGNSSVKSTPNNRGLFYRVCDDGEDIWFYQNNKVIGIYHVDNIYEQLKDKLQNMILFYRQDWNFYECTLFTDLKDKESVVKILRGKSFTFHFDFKNTLSIDLRIKCKNVGRLYSSHEIFKIGAKMPKNISLNADFLSQTLGTDVPQLTRELFDTLTYGEKVSFVRHAIHVTQNEFLGNQEQEDNDTPTIKINKTVPILKGNTEAQVAYHDEETGENYYNSKNSYIYVGLSGSHFHKKLEGKNIEKRMDIGGYGHGLYAQSDLDELFLKAG